VSNTSLKKEEATQKSPGLSSGSVLTKMLASSLGGRARTVLVACVAPTSDSKDETISTLRFASMATHVQNDIDKERAQAVEASKPLVETPHWHNLSNAKPAAACKCGSELFYKYISSSKPVG